MKGLYIVIGVNGMIYGAYDSDEAAKECLRHATEHAHGVNDLSPVVRYVIVNKNYWEEPEWQKHNSLYDIE